MFSMSEERQGVQHSWSKGEEGRRKGEKGIWSQIVYGPVGDKIFMVYSE